MSEAGDGLVARELARRARASGITIAGFVAVAVPAWNGFDQLLEPDLARRFLLVRLLCDVPVLACLWLLRTRPLGRRRPELLTFLVLALTQVEIAWMLPQVTGAPEPYLLGLTLAIYGSGCLMAGRPRWTVALVVTTYAALLVADLTATRPLPPRALAAAVFYLATAAAIGVLAHVLRHRLALRELRARDALEREQHRTGELLDRLERLSHEDALTGLANRRRWDAELDAACARARDEGAALAVVLIDLDRFKDINDRYGHAGGDEALRVVARLLLRRVRATDLVARLGGDELAVLLRSGDDADAHALAERLRRDAEVLGDSGGTTPEVTLSLGVAGSGPGRDLPHELMRCADQQLYLAKATRNAVCAAAAPAALG